MLAQGSALAAQGVDVVVAHVETHHRPIPSPSRGMEQIHPRHRLPGTRFEEMDTDAVITRKPDVALVDELAHTNVPAGATPSVGRTSKTCLRRHRCDHQRQRPALESLARQPSR